MQLEENMNSFIRSSFAPNKEEARKSSIMSMQQLRASQVMMENAIKSNLSNMLRRSEKFAAKVSMSRKSLVDPQDQ
jgi:predicted nuclease of restriction endonuclease-like (RecB) superfamily